MKSGTYDDILYESKEEIEEALDIIIEKVTKDFAEVLKAAVKSQISDEEIAEDLWGRDALQTFVADLWAEFEPDIGDINTEHEED